MPKKHGMLSAPSQAAVDAGNLFCFASDVGQQPQDDLLDSNLLAQLAADKRYSRFTAVMDWYSLYTETLGKIAWQIGGMKMSQQETGDVFTVEEIVLKQLGKALPPAYVQLAAHTMETLRLLAPETKPQLVFQMFDHDQGIWNATVSLQVSVIAPPTDAWLIGLYFQTEQSIDNALDTEFDATLLKAPVQAGLVSATLNEEIYKTIRQSVIDKLGAKRDDFIVRFPVEPASTS